VNRGKDLKGSSWIQMIRVIGGEIRMGIDGAKGKIRRMMVSERILMNERCGDEWRDKRGRYYWRL
jgi:hypothetical protein